jgi:hypothetical protein
MTTAARGWTVALIIAVLLLAGLGIQQSFRSDEVWSIQRAQEPWSTMMAQLRADIHPPLYYLLLRGWMRIAGDSEFGTRLLCVLLNFGAALALWRFSGKRVAGLIYLASPVALVAAHLTRMYAILGLCAAVSTVLFLKLNQEKEPRKSDWIWYVLANVAGSFTHVWFFFLLLAQGACRLVLFRGKRLSGFTVAWAISIAPYAALWLPVLLEQRARHENLAWLKAPGAVDAIKVIAMLGGGSLAVAAAALWARRGRDLGRAWAAPLVLFSVTLAVPFAFSFVQPMFGIRFSIVALPALCLAIAAVADGMAAEAGVVAIGLLVALSTFFGDASLDSRNTAKLLEREARRGDLVVFTSLSRLAVEHYIARDGFAPTWSATSFPKTIDAHPGYVGQLDQQSLTSEAGELLDAAKRDQVQRVFLFESADPQYDTPLKDLLERDFTRLAQPGIANSPGTNYVKTLTVYSSRSTSSGF